MLRMPLWRFFDYKEVIQPHVPVRLPCLSSSETMLLTLRDFWNPKDARDKSLQAIGPLILPISLLYDLALLAEL